MSELSKDLTQGSVGKNLIKFSLPFLLANLIQALYSVTDMLVVGWYSGEAGISGVAIGSQVTMLVTNFVVGFTVGGTVLVAQYFGAKRERDVRESIGTLFTLLAAAAVVMTAVFIALSEPALKLLNTPAESFSNAKTYLNICMLGTVFIFGYNAVSSILRGLGDSKRPLWFVAIACALNVGLDFLFVGAFGMSSAGAAAATVISQGVALVLSVLYLRSKEFLFDFRLSSFKMHRDKLSGIFRIGLPSSVQNVVVSLSFLVMTAIANRFGVDASAAMGVVAKFNGFAILPAIAMSMSISSMAGQNIGAGEPGRAKRTMWIGMRISFCISAAIFALVQLFPQEVLRIFSDKPAVIDAGVDYLRTFSFDFLAVPFLFSFNGLIIASGHSLFSMLNGVSAALLLRAPLAYLFGVALGWGMAGIGIAAPGASFGALMAAFVFVQSGRWKRGGLKVGKELAL